MKGKSARVAKYKRRKNKVERNATEVDRMLYLKIDPWVDFAWLSIVFIGS